MVCTFEAGKVRERVAVPEAHGFGPGSKVFQEAKVLVCDRGGLVRSEMLDEALGIGGAESIADGVVAQRGVLGRNRGLLGPVGAAGFNPQGE